MSSYTLAFGILGVGWLVAGIMWSVPRLRRRRALRHFRTELAHVEVIALGWAHSLRERGPVDPDDEDRAPLPPARRQRRSRRLHPGAEGPLV